MQNRRLNQFYLVGGTALALQLGHRISVDLDLFTNKDFNFYDIYELLKYFPLETMLQLFSKKYPDIAHFHILKSLVYFDDAEDQFDPVS